jgi:hypothetical protein
LQKGSKAKSRPHAASEIYFAGPLFHLSLPQQELVFNSRVFCRFFYLLCSEAMAASAAAAQLSFFLRSEYQSNSGARLSSVALKYSNIIKRPAILCKDEVP